MVAAEDVPALRNIKRFYNTQESLALFPPPPFNPKTNPVHDLMLTLDF